MRTYNIIIAVIITFFATLSFEAQAQNINANAAVISSLNMALSIASEDEKGDASNAPLILQSTLTCPKCSHTQTEKMATESSLYFYKCGGCAEMVKAEKGQCCVFCSFADVPCPSKQQVEQK